MEETSTFAQIFLQYIFFQKFDPANDVPVRYSEDNLKVCRYIRLHTKKYVKVSTF